MKALGFAVFWFGLLVACFGGWPLVAIWVGIWITIAIAVADRK